MKKEPKITITETTQEIVAAYFAKQQARIEKRLKAKEEKWQERLKREEEEKKKGS